LVLTLLAVVHWPDGLRPVEAQQQRPARSAKGAATASAAPRPDTLPAPVAGMRDKLRVAAGSGLIEELRPVLDWNELPPEVADTPVADPIAHWRGISVDGEGRDVLAALAAILDLKPVTVPLAGRRPAAHLYVWPYLAERPLAALAPAERADLERLVGTEAAARMTASGRYTGWRLVIGADGTWHSFRRE
jgi:hypothetical protein